LLERGFNAIGIFDIKTKKMLSYPRTRLRRNRYNYWSRELLAETTLTRKDLIAPIFIQEGSNLIQPIKALPGVYLFTLDKALEQIKILYDEGIVAIALFPKIADNLKDPEASQAFLSDNLICRAIIAIKKAIPGIALIADIALDPYTSHGYDGLLNTKGEVDNDLTLEALARQALVLAQAGADVLAPSDMMDGRIGFIRDLLEREAFHQVQLFSYGVKFASCLYKPFRDTIASCEKLDKRNYFVDYRNSREVLLEMELDSSEGADALIVKPGGFYLDIIKEVSQKFLLPVIAYQVSGEYALLEAGIASGIAERKALVLESLFAFKRAGARAIITYYASQAVKWLPC
jgi:porphobilinogen synthase